MKKFRICFLVIVLLAGIVFLIPAHSQSGTSAREVHLSQAEPVGNSVRVTRILMLGCDRAAALTDSIMLLTVESPSGNIRILQIPRDTYAAYTERDYKKLNGAYNALGLDGMKQFLSASLGISIDYVAAIDLDCVSALVDAVGGVDVEVPQAMQYTDPSQNLTIDLQPGLQHLDGEQAEHYLRFRSGYANADLGRMDAQKLFLQSFLKKSQSMGSTGILQILWTMLPRAQTDIPVQEAIRLIRLLPNADLSEVPMATAPGEAVQGSSGAWYYSLNRAGMIRTVREFLLSPDAEPAFDPNRVFDRQDFPKFHEIYTAPDSGAGAEKAE